MKNPSTPSSPLATSGEEVGPPPSPLKLGKESERIKKPPPQMFKTATASSSPPPATEWSHDVFLSFIGKDSWKFTNQLCTALVQKGIITFRDDGELEMGISIVPEMGISIVPEMGISIVPKLFEAIEQSRCVIAILSTNYASSTCCLEDLAKAVESMKETGKKVFPVFYDVHPAEVRNQTGYFGEAFSKHEQSFKDDMERVRKWRAALTEVAQIAGWDLLHG